MYVMPRFQQYPQCTQGPLKTLRLEPLWNLASP